MKDDMRPPYIEIRLAPHRHDPCEPPLVIVSFQDSSSTLEFFLSLEEALAMSTSMKKALEEAVRLMKRAAP